MRVKQIYGWNRNCARCAAGLPPPENRTLADVKCQGCIGYSKRVFKKGKKMYNELAKFRKAHGIEYSPGDLHSNVNDEVTEALREIFKGNILALIGEFCDIAIFTINGLEQLGHDAKSNIEKAGENAMTESRPTPTQAIAAIKMAQSHYLLNKDVHALALTANIAMSAIDALGYHAEKCVLEKAICINSRNGEHNAEAGKWQKDSNQNPATLYNPDYLNCKK